MWVIAPLERALVRARVSPLVFNLAGVGLGAAAGVAYAQGAPAAGGWLVVVRRAGRGEGLGVSFRGGLMQRAERLVLLALASLLDPVAVTALHWAAGSLLVLA